MCFQSAVIQEWKTTYERKKNSNVPILKNNNYVLSVNLSAALCDWITAWAV